MLEQYLKHVIYSYEFLLFQLLLFNLSQEKVMVFILVEREEEQSRFLGVNLLSINLDVNVVKQGHKEPLL